MKSRVLRYKNKDGIKRLGGNYKSLDPVFSSFELSEFEKELKEFEKCSPGRMFDYTYISFVN